MVHLKSLPIRGKAAIEQMGHSPIPGRGLLATAFHAVAAGENQYLFFVRDYGQPRDVGVVRGNKAMRAIV